MRLLVAEDERNLNKVIVKQLIDSGYGVDSCYDGESALDFIEATDYDAVIMDIMMPKQSGLEVLKQMRRHKDATPVLMLTAKAGLEDVVDGLDAGADDYMTKPFAFEELLARIRVLVRKKTGNASNTIQLANLEVNTQSRTVTRNGEEISLSSKEYAILEYMITNKNAVLSRDQLEQHVWGYDYGGYSNIIDVYIRYLRKKIDENYDPKLIHTVRGTGYVLREK